MFLTAKVVTCLSCTGDRCLTEPSVFALSEFFAMGVSQIPLWELTSCGELLEHVGYIWDVWWLTASWMLLWLTDWPFFSVCFPFLLTHSGQDNLCSPSDILQLNLSVKRTVETLLSLGTDSEESSLVSLSIQLWGFVVFYCTLMLTLCMFYRWVFFL